MIDQDNDGLISSSDLKIMLDNLGQPSSDDAVQKYFVATDKINFTQFLTMFGEHLDALDDASVLTDAFECFDDKDEGWIQADELRSWLSEVGDRMNDDEVCICVCNVGVESGGKSRSASTDICYPPLNRSIVYSRDHSWIAQARSSITKPLLRPSRCRNLLSSSKASRD